jgi:tryptophan synthase alpha subunit
MAYADLDLGKIDPVTRAGLDGLLMVGGEERSDRKDLALILDQDDIRNCGLVPIGFSQHHLHVARHLNGYVMIQASAGVTGPRPALSEGLGASIAQLRRAGISRPILAGFGIGTAEQARHAVACGADGVVIGSMCVRKVVEGANAIRAFLAEVRSALDV